MLVLDATVAAAVTPFITAAWDATSGALTLVAVGDVAPADVFQTALRAVVFLCTTPSPDTTQRLLSFTVYGTDTASLAVTRSVDVVRVPDAARVTPSAATLSLIDTETFEVLPSAADNAGETKGFVFSAISGGMLTLVTDGGAVIAGQVVGTLPASLGVLFTPGNAIGSGFGFTVDTSSDGVSVSPLSTPVVVSVTLTAPVFVPAVYGLEVAPAQYLEGSIGTYFTQGVVLQCPVPLTSATIAITANYVQGEDTLVYPFVAPDGRRALQSLSADLTSSFDATTGVFTLSGDASDAVYTQAVRAVGFAITSQRPSVAQRVLTLTVTTSSGASLPVSRPLAVTAVNDPPVAQPLLRIRGVQDGPPVRFTLPGSDPDSAAFQGKLVLAPSTGLLTVCSDGGSSVPVTLDSPFTGPSRCLEYTPAAGVSGWPVTTMEFVLVDDGDVASVGSTLVEVNVVSVAGPIINERGAESLGNVSAPDGTVQVGAPHPLVFS